MTLKNEALKEYEFLKGMYRDQYYPNFLVDKGKDILINLCTNIESQSPKTKEEVLKLTHQATDKFNDLQEAFWQHDSEIETVAREYIAEDFISILKAYGFEIDIEDAISTRDW
ncbi:DUF5713 family protein [Vibrio nigripulchritudo]|uniref:DUF5713 family protein n=1 Tax=Vibrio nigripulchritudo TaxID=28173 RepID=UPI0003B2111A|nr:DUF5713 family protein [Vibrio nigripulchritudo]CCN72760.1 conserved hypothetical protein [Vibrio nigripulchritudo SFn118]